MLHTLRSAVAILAVLTLITGVAYPLLVTLVAQSVFPHQADGSLIVDSTKAVGSELIGQPFTHERYFWGRPSATEPTPYNAAASTGSNFGPTNPAQFDAVKIRVAALKESASDAQSRVPIDLATASGSGLDPHISPAAAEYQVQRVARARGASVETIRRILAQHTAGRKFGVLGEPRINVLQLNLALDRHEATAAK